MSILGKWVDIQTWTRAADALAGVTMTTVPHSLPGTSGDAQIPWLRSIGQAAANQGVDNTRIFCPGANASLSTIGFASGASTVTTPVLAGSIISIMFHTVIR